jgi:RNA-directed DNA polymerase
LEHRVGDPRILRLINRMLKAGVMEDGLVRASEKGTPQGSVLTPRTQKITLNLLG